MITEQQYNSLRPHREHIAMVVANRSAVNPQGWEEMQAAWVSQGNEPAQGGCAACAMMLYDGAWALINEYEQANGGSQG